MDVTLIPLVAIVGGLTIVALGMFKTMRLKELEYRERIAMIERGLMPPPPAADPLGRGDRAYRYARRSDRDVFARASRHRTAGVVLLGIGLSLMVLISFTADPNIGIGIGGAFAVLGLAFIGNSLLELHLAERQMPPVNFDDPSSGRNPPSPPAPPPASPPDSPTT